MEKRRYKRIKTEQCSADLSDGNGFFTGSVGDISQEGVLVIDIPRRIDRSTKSMTIVASLSGKNFKIVARPRWIKENGKNVLMGLEIVNAPQWWKELVKKIDPNEIENDIWAGVALKN